jgi:hypothetical protein
VPFQTMPTLAEWKAGTSSFAHSRSDALQRVDRAIAQYHLVRTELALSQVAAALDYWIRVKQDEAGDNDRTGTAWKKSARNKKLYVEHLHQFLNPRPENISDPADRAAREVVDQAIAAAAKNIFKGTRVDFKLFGAKQKARITVAERVTTAKSQGWFHQAASTVASRAPRVAQAAQLVKSTGSSVRDAAGDLREGVQTAMQSGLHVPSFADQTQAFIKQITGTDSPSAVQKVMDVAGFHSLSNFAANCAPFIGIISGGLKVTQKIYAIVEKRMDRSDLRARAHVLRPGDPKAAFEALDRMLDDEIDDATRELAIEGAAFVAKTALGFADGGVISGPAIGAAQTLAEIVLLIKAIAGEYREKEEANKLLAQISADGAVFDLQLFEKCPLVACYFLMIADTSTVLFVMTSTYGQPGWQLDVENMKKICDPILKKAAYFIDDSRLEINLLSAHRLAFEKTHQRRVIETGESVKRRMLKFLRSAKVSPQETLASVEDANASPGAGTDAATAPLAPAAADVSLLGGRPVTRARAYTI